MSYRNATHMLRKFTAGLVLSAGFMLSPAANAPAADTAAFKQVGSIERFPADARDVLGEELVPFPGNETQLQKDTGGTVIVMPASRQLVQLFPHPFQDPTTGVVVRELDTLRIVRTARLGFVFTRASGSPDGGGDWDHAVDAAGTRLWLMSGVRIVQLDLRSLSVSLWALPTSVGGTQISYPVAVGGLTYDAFHDDLLVLYSGPPFFSVANSNTFLYRLDVSGAPRPVAEATDSAKLYRLRSCSGPVTSTDVGSDTANWDILVTKDHLYVPCQRAGHTVVVVRMPRPEGNDPAHPENVSAGPVYGESVLADQASGRLFVTTYRREIWVFDTATMSFIGVVATGPDNTNDRTGYGLDVETGRVFFQSVTFGLGVVEGRFFPIPQARTMARLATGQERIWSDARTSRVFVLESHIIDGKALSYRIYRTSPAPVPPRVPDPDRNTADVNEREGVTEARWNASASGYGTRVLLAKGLAGVPPQPVLGTEAHLANALWRAQTSKPCDFADRDLFAGRVSKAEYDTGSTAAKAVAVAVDGATEQDLNQPERCNRSFGPGNWTRWDHPAAECASNEGNVPEEPSQGAHRTPPALGPATATCRAPGEPLDAHAETSFFGATVDVQRSWTTTRVERLEGGGVRARVEAVAQGISIGNQIHIGEVRSKAVSVSNGRPRRPDMSTHEIAIADVRVGGVSLCDQGLCRDPVKLEEDLNVLAGGRAVFRTGHGPNSGRDEALVRGSDRGAQTAVQKSVARQASDRALIGDFTVEVPAFEVTVFNDNTNWGRARQLYQFAGVASSATYNIVVRPTGFGLDDPGPTGVPDGDVALSGGFPAVLDDAFGGQEPTEQDFSHGLPIVADAHNASGKGESGPIRVLRAVAGGLRLFLTSPHTALLLLTAWALLISPAMLARRRRLLRT